MQNNDLSMVKGRINKMHCLCAKVNYVIESYVGLLLIEEGEKYNVWFEAKKLPLHLMCRKKKG